MQMKTLDRIIYDYKNNGYHKNDNANTTVCASGLYNWIVQNHMKKHALVEIAKFYPESAKAHDRGDLHFHDLWTAEYMPYCSSFPLESIIMDGLKLSKRAGPPKHLSTVLNQLINFTTSVQQEVAGAIAFGDVDVLLAPFVKNDGLNYRQVRQEIQSLYFNLNQPSRYGFQSPFMNFNICQAIPKRYDDKVPYVGGEEMTFTYHDCKNEIDMINRAFCEIHVDGDYHGAPFTFPIITVELSPEFDYDSEMSRYMFEMTALRGQPYFLNYNVDYLDRESILAMCCRLNINYAEVQAHLGGTWSIGESTGSLGVVSLNMPRLGYTCRDDDELFYRIDELLYMARKQLNWKRKNVLKSYEMGMIPTIRTYLPRKLKTHFNTIGIIGMHDMCMNYLGKPIWEEESVEFVNKVLGHVREKITEFQKIDKTLWNLEQTPAERTAARFAYYDKKRFRGKSYISINVDGKEEYTNSTHLPVDVNDLYLKVKIEGEFQRIFTGGCMTHIFIDELPNFDGLSKFIKNVAENSSLGYFSVTPNLTHCEKCRKSIVGSYVICPTCGGDVEIWSRIVGYYRPVSGWNPSKREEFHERAEFSVNEKIYK
ncbi:MAG: ribonucleoside triphosphate reductase [Promethearchaeota archaeon]|nr:MAG: ribonucleoside-triphosphate reductase [Helarchaeota virus Nidhogg Meg22_1012]URC17331.1 MAG: anaerobic ribonucleoside-triphosphate reductase [Helarchaeota virus Nidhogg Meg22_1214]